MKDEFKNGEKICAFYASDYHFEMITLPYLYNNLDKDIVILTENDLNDTVNVLLSKMNFNEDKKRKILSLDWTSNDLEKFRIIKNNVNNNTESLIIIKGNENFIKNTNFNLEKWNKVESKFKIIDCYDVEEIATKMDEIIEKYDKMLKVAGEVIIDKK